MNVNRMSLLQLAPGGSLGRLCVWTEDAIKKLNELYGDYRNASTLKKGYHLPRAMMTNADVARIINSDEVQSVLVAAKEAPVTHGKKKNALKNKKLMLKLNPAAGQLAASRKRAREAGTKEAEGAMKDKKAHGNKGKVFYDSMMKAFEDAAAKAQAKP